MKRTTHTIAAGVAALTLLVAACGDDGTARPAVAVSTGTSAGAAGLPTNGLPASALGAEQWADAQPTESSPTADASERWSNATDKCTTQPSPDAIERCVTVR